MIAYFAILFTKILGALYSIPFYAIVGEEGGVLYSYSYTIYNLFLSISTAGIPVAMSIVISEYNALKYYRSKQRAYKTGLGMISIISAVAFLGLFIFAEQIAAFYVKDIVGGPSVADIALNIRSISLCLVVIPFLSVTRGYFQGHEYLSVSSYSQIIEQIMRIFVVLAGSFIAMRIFNASATIGVAIALSGAFIGGIIAFLYLISKYKKNNRQFNPIDYIPTNEDDVPIRAIIKRILYFSIPLVLVSVSTNLYTITDMKLVLLDGMPYYKLSLDADGSSGFIEKKTVTVTLSTARGTEAFNYTVSVSDYIEKIILDSPEFETYNLAISILGYMKAAVPEAKRSASFENMAAKYNTDSILYPIIKDSENSDKSSAIDKCELVLNDGIAKFRLNFNPDFTGKLELCYLLGGVSVIKSAEIASGVSDGKSYVDLDVDILSMAEGIKVSVGTDGHLYGIADCYSEDSENKDVVHAIYCYAKCAKAYLEGKEVQ